MASTAENSTKTAEKPFDPISVFRVVDGVGIPVIFEEACKRPMEDHVDLLKKMELSPDDVLLVAFAKSGTHWIWEVVSMLLTGKADYEKRTKEFAMMEATEIEQLESQPSPKVLNSHLPLRLLPRQVKEKKVKVIHVYRNIKDVIVSGYFHFRQMPVLKDVTLEGMSVLTILPPSTTVISHCERE
ncbi:sulfotransferase 1 family member D1-like [Babylonia areolata]|uniref:sulfotransferase 1 family member D1-like n=1 Tax=Babylonia areolata TaxID=304850 RepID=UPI003FD2FB6A